MAEAIIKSPEELREKIALYVQECKDPKNKRKPTQAGLTLALGYSNVGCIRDLGRRGDDYKNELSRFKLYLEDDRNQILLTPGQPTVGAIFDLKCNHGYDDGRKLTDADGKAIGIVYVTNIDRGINKEPEK